MNEVEFYLEDLKSKFSKISPNEYYLSYSGGKDSHFLYWFIKEYLKDTKIQIVGINTYMEHQQILDRIYKNSDIVLKPVLKPFQIKEKYGIPCFSKMQDEIIDRYQRGTRTESVLNLVYGKDKSWYKLNNTAKELLLNNKLHKVSPKCCQYLKKIPARKYEKDTNKKAILGIRGEESIRRKAKYTSCFTKDKKFTPLYDLKDDLIDEIYKYCNIEIPKIYDLVTRTGCMGCPYGSWKGGTVKELALVTDNQYKFLWEYFGESYKVLNISKYRQLTLF